MSGTLAIDLGSTTTVVAFQPADGRPASLLSLPPYSLGEPALVPSLVWCSLDPGGRPLIGRQVLEAGLASDPGPRLSRDFKRRIGAAADPAASDPQALLSPEEAGGWLLRSLWEAVPAELQPERLVLTAPIETYRGYRRWLQEVSRDLPVAELALVDEPTAAAMGSGLAAGSLVLVVDLGGGTIDLSLVRLEGGEGRAAPMAQLLRFAGRDLLDSRQRLRCARVLGKAGLALGGRDIDRWLAEHLCPGSPLTAALLDVAEQLKLALSSDTEAMAIWSDGSGPSRTLQLQRHELEAVLRQQGLLAQLDRLLEEILAAGRRHGLALSNIDAVLPVGGSSRIPLIQRWLQERCSGIPLRSERPLEAVALGALALTPGVTVRDVLSHGVALRCWDRRSARHRWHPLFVAGQSWPTQQPLELALACSEDQQESLELVLGEPQPLSRGEVLYEDGRPVLQQRQAGDATVIPWPQAALSCQLDPPGRSGEDRLWLRFSIDAEAQLVVEISDLRGASPPRQQRLGSVR
ncbi:MAG: Hsp70 family protein [Prochlorococcaceae cyanobacterium]